MSKEWAQGPCGCCNDPGLCIYVCCCHCLAYKEAAENIGDDNGLVYCLVDFPLGFGCCVATMLGDKVAEKRGIESSLGKSAMCACCDACVCYSCSFVNESRLYKQEQEQAKTGVQGQEMERK